MWQIPKIWDGGECWIIGGGPSLSEQFEIPIEVVQKVVKKEETPSAYSPYMKAIHKKHVIGINMSFMIGGWIDMVFFGDKRWYINNREPLSKFPGLKVTCHPYFKNKRYESEKIKYVPKDRNKGKGVSSNKNTVCWNANSGGAAISVAVHMGVKRIVLVGFDMKLSDDQRQHWHSYYKSALKVHRKQEHKLPFHRHLLGFPEIKRDAKKMGVEILNASPESAIDCFKKVSVKDLL